MCQTYENLTMLSRVTAKNVETQYRLNLTKTVFVLHIG